MNSLTSQVLVLNRLWQPVNICGVKRAIGLLFVGHAQVASRGNFTGGSGDALLMSWNWSLSSDALSWFLLTHK